MKLPRLLFIMAISSALSACSCNYCHIPAVAPFSAERFLGRWYEIARLPNSFEEGLSDISAEYSIMKSGDVRVLNRGYDPTAKRWRSAEGRAYFTQGRHVGELRVTFFWPFFGWYRIIELDQANYGHMLIAGGDGDLLWILARTPKLETSVLQGLIDRASALGFDTDKLIFVNHLTAG